jgi:aminodeoxyfutalosine synthase
MNYLLIPKELRPIAEKVETRQRISEADAVALYRSNDLNALGIMANVVREQKNGNYATYIHNRYINYSNICVLSCQFCAFAARKRDAHAFEYAIDEIVAAVRDALGVGITEVHMVGGLHPTLKKDWYLKLLRDLRALATDLHIKAFTAIEVRHLAQRIFHMPIRDTLEVLREAGLDSMTGGGAEIFDAAVRDKICRGKETAAEWLDVHRTWHQMGGRSTCTMLYGHIETLAHRADHLRQLRELQDETGGFTGFIPFAFQPQTTVLSHIKAASAVEELRNLAVSRIYLDNIDHLTAYWLALVCRWRRSHLATELTICMARSWKKKSFTWRARPLPNSKRWRRWNKRFVKLVANPSSATAFTGICLRRRETEQNPHRQRKLN